MTGVINERPPVADAEPVQQQPGHECPDHVLGAMGEVDDVQHAEDDRKPRLSIA
jgi:hypothetical protein